jgi:hypothetical protein
MAVDHHLVSKHLSELTEKKKAASPGPFKADGRTVLDAGKNEVCVMGDVEFDCRKIDLANAQFLAAAINLPIEDHLRDLLEENARLRGQLQKQQSKP